jgi:hypothetical protein
LPVSKLPPVSVTSSSKILGAFVEVNKSINVVAFSGSKISESTFTSKGRLLTFKIRGECKGVSPLVSVHAITYSSLIFFSIVPFTGYSALKLNTG